MFQLPLRCADANKRPQGPANVGSAERPGGQVFSWVPGSTNVPVLVAGLAPAGRGMTTSAISFTALLGSPPQHLFSAADPPGLYSLLVVLVVAGSDPSDPRHWFGAAMSPLIISK